jgi:hypothetical protein
MVVPGRVGQLGADDGAFVTKPKEGCTDNTVSDTALSAIIVNWNARDMLVQRLQSILADYEPLLAASAQDETARHSAHQPSIKVLWWIIPRQIATPSRCGLAIPVGAGGRGDPLRQGQLLPDRADDVCAALPQQVPILS